MKKLITANICFLLIFAWGSIHAEDAVLIDDFYYTLNADTKTAIVSRPPSGKYGSISRYSFTIPSTVTYQDEEYTVTEIGEYAFYYDAKISEITLPNTIKRIGRYAFAYHQDDPYRLTINIPEGITTIEEGTFYACYVKSIQFPNSLTTINAYAFAYASTLGNLVLPPNLKTIGNSAFRNCGMRSPLVIPQGVTTIGEDAFADNYNMFSVVVPSSVTSIGGNAFYYINEGRGIYVNWENPIALSAHISMANDYHTQVYVPCGTKEAYEAADIWKNYGIIENCEGGTVTSYQVTVNANDDLGQTTGSGTYQRGTYATISVIPNDGYSFISWSDGNLNNPRAVAVYKDTVISAILDLTPPCILASGTCGAEGDNLTWELSCDSVLTISGTGAMADYSYNSEPWYENGSAIKSAIIEEGVTNIGNYAFCNCTKLTAITIANSVTSIEDDAFYGCRSLLSITLPNSVTSIGGYAFYDCNSLTSIEIPSSVTSIGHYTFSSCTGLTAMTVEAGNAVYDSRNHCNAIIETATNKLVAGCQNTIIPSSVTSIGETAFYGFTNLTSIDIPSSVTSIEYNAFSRCAGLTSVTIPSSVTSIGYRAFKDCTGMTSITCEATTPPTLGSDAFNNVGKSIPVYVPCASIESYIAAESWSEFTNYQAVDSIHVTYSITSSNDLAGTISITNETEYCDRIELTIRANKNSGYEFVQWSDGVSTNPRQVELRTDSTITAMFAAIEPLHVCIGRNQLVIYNNPYGGSIVFTRVSTSAIVGTYDSESSPQTITYPDTWPTGTYLVEFGDGDRKFYVTKE